jgi:hypothetical protein
MQNNYEIFDNAVSKQLQEQIKKVILDSSNFAWFYSDEDTPGYETTIKDNNIKTTIQFAHNFYTHDNIKSPYYYQIIKPLLKELSLEKKIIRAKANLLLQQIGFTKDNFNKPHTDFNVKHKVLIYYVLDSDGDTILFNNNKIHKRITPKQGRILMFDGSVLHASCNPIETKKRIVLNIDLA